MTAWPAGWLTGWLAVDWLAADTSNRRLVRWLVCRACRERETGEDKEKEREVREGEGEKAGRRETQVAANILGGVTQVGSL